MTDAKIFPHIRCTLPSPHLYLAPLLTFPSGRRTVARDYRRPSSCSPALSSPPLCLFLPLFLPLSIHVSLSLSTLNKDAQPPKILFRKLYKTSKVFFQSRWRASQVVLLIDSFTSLIVVYILLQLYTVVSFT